MDAPKAEQALSIAEVARRLGLSPATVRAWPVGIRVGGKIVRLECSVIGTRCKVTEEQLAKFQSDCHKAKFGHEPPARQETPAQAARRAAEAKQRALDLCRS